LNLIALQWDAAAKQLLFDGEGPGKGMLYKAFNDLASSLDRTDATNTISGVLRDSQMDNESASTLVQSKRFAIS